MSDTLLYIIFRNKFFRDFDSSLANTFLPSFRLFLTDVAGESGLFPTFSFLILRNTEFVVVVVGLNKSYSFSMCGALG